MIRSMTGYGRGENKDNYNTVVEIRSVNHRFLDIYVRMSKPWLFLEDKIKSYIRGKILRGRVDVFINFSSENLPVTLKIDKSLANNYYKKLIELKNETGYEGPVSLSLLSIIPNIITLEEDPISEQELWNALLPALNEAMDELIKMRKKEGENLWEDIAKRLLIIENMTESIKERAEIVPQEYAKKLKHNVEKLCQDICIERDRIEAEVVLFAEKSNITEEVIRIRSHIAQMRELVNSEKSVGKNMDFIAQEIFREINTIAAKSSDYNISKNAIEIKSQLEKIREQIQNIE
ncbi:MAG: YicC/YloC family endoribonuclease [Tepidanaerobacteraceae bacterium]|nr:YicC family protein [Thermoanaerobacterales bacterium]